MTDNVGRYYIYNGQLKGIDKDEMPVVIGDKAVYEVIRLIEGVPLFIQDHYERMLDSVMSVGCKVGFSYEDLSLHIKKLAKANNSKNCNIKAMAFFSGSEDYLLLYMSKSFYPSPEIFEEGVKVGLLQVERENPNIKLANQSYRGAAEKKIKQEGFFEVLLCNKDGSITEGSKSNVFFVKGNNIFTAPGTHVLKGITRKYVFEACKTAGYEVFETLTSIGLMKDMDGIFLSGTSIKVLPVKSVEDQNFQSSSSSVIRAVSREYNGIINKYIYENIK